MQVAFADIQDAEEILALQKLAYRSEAEIYDDFSIPPLHQTIEEMEGDIRHKTVLKMAVDGKIIGSVRCKINEGTGFIGRLIIHPDFQNYGLGTQLLLEIERHFRQAQRFELFTGDRSERNLYLYQKMGYRLSRSEQISDKTTIVFMEKTNL